MFELWRLLSITWLGVPVAGVAVFVIGGLMYVAMSRSTSIRPSPSAMRISRPGWIARWRARGGISHDHDKIGIGYTSALRSIHLTLRELADHGSVFGGPDSGKTTFLRLLIEAAAERIPCVIVDPKGSPGARGDGASPRWRCLDTRRSDAS